MSGLDPAPTEDDFLGWVLKYLLSADARHEYPLRAAPGWNALDSVLFRRIFLSGAPPMTELVVLFSFAQVPTVVVGKSTRVSAYLANPASGSGPQTFEPAQRAALAFCKRFLKDMPGAVSNIVSKTDEIHWVNRTPSEADEALSL